MMSKFKSSFIIGRKLLVYVFSIINISTNLKDFLWLNIPNQRYILGHEFLVILKAAQYYIKAFTV
jgi:hypothetical protein